MTTARLAILLLAVGCGEPSPPPAPPEAPLSATYEGVFAAVPAAMETAEKPRTPELVSLGRMLYFDPRLSKDHQISCNSCHPLDRYGVDGEVTSPGHGGARGTRNSPSSYHAALHVSQFWDGREPDVEAQAKQPILNPIEMAMPDGDAVVAMLSTIPGYVDAFAEAFPDDEQPISYDHMADAIGAFERGLVTPAPFDAFLRGDSTALNDAQKEGLDRFVRTGCIVCHNGPGVGGAMYQKLGLVEDYDTPDLGRGESTGLHIQDRMFKVPSLRNVTETGPYFHDGSIETLEEAVQLMAQHQLGKTLYDREVAQIVTFLGALKGTPDPAYIAAPQLPPDGPDTPSAQAD
ncbi:MAG: c-type cytochrome [Deltaproteobacteria bacterium]|nr:MAG: c-type cytochrome [Deltaproteobacteria bacterium]